MPQESFIVPSGGNHTALEGGGSRAPLLKLVYATRGEPQPTQRVCNQLPSGRDTTLSKKVLVVPVEARLKELLAEVAIKYGFEILAVEVMPDHVHLFVNAPPNLLLLKLSVCSRG